jgi:hypothetical protein
MGVNIVLTIVLIRVHVVETNKPIHLTIRRNLSKYVDGISSCSIEPILPEDTKVFDKWSRRCITSTSAYFPWLPSTLPILLTLVNVSGCSRPSTFSRVFNPHDASKDPKRTFVDRSTEQSSRQDFLKFQRSFNVILLIASRDIRSFS